MSGPFAAGERVLLIDGKDRHYLLTLREGGEFHTHAGITSHDAIIGRPEGITVRSGTGARYVAVRPTLADFVLAMPRGAQVIYPKDLGPLLVMGDIFPGARVLEAGVGSGALSMTLLRAGAHVVGYEIRDDFAAKARANVDSFFGLERSGGPERPGERSGGPERPGERSGGPERPGVSYRVEARDVYEGIDERGLDRVMLDLPEPWQVVGHAEVALDPGGIFVSYLPTIGQVAQLRERLQASAFGLARTVEVLERGWHVEGQSVRPDHRMVAHTGFLTSARLLGPRSGGRSGPGTEHHS